MAQLDELEQRLTTLSRRLTGAPAGAGPASLDDRLGQLRVKLRQASHELTRQLHFAHGPGLYRTTADRTQLPRSLSMQLQRLSRVRDDLESMSARQPLSPVQARSHEMGLAMARWLDEVAPQPAPTPLAEDAALLAVAGLVEHVESLTNRLQAEQERQQQDAEQLEVIERLHHDLLSGVRPTWQALTDLAERIIAQSDREQTPTLGRCEYEEPAAWLAQHSHNTALVVNFLCQQDPRWLSHRLPLTLAALVQDVGMRRINPSILSQPGPCDRQQRQQIEAHPIMAERILEQYPEIDAEFALAAGRHHDRLDGAGYPHGVEAGSLSGSARLLAIADSFAARLEPRPYRRPQSYKQAITETLFDADAGKLDHAWATRLLNLSLFPIGTRVELSTGETAEVIAVHQAHDNPSLAAAPIVKLLTDADGGACHPPVYRNLALRPDCRILRQLHVYD